MDNPWINCIYCLLKVNTIEINYAKMAKKMDMKKLKTTMWGLLTESPEKTAKVCNCNFLGLLKLFYFNFSVCFS